MLVTSKLASLVLELIFLLTGNRLFAESNQVCQVPDKNSRQTGIRHHFGCRVSFGVGSTRQRFCRVLSSSVA